MGRKRSERGRASTGRRARPELRAVFFDLDDTLFDHAGTRRAALREVLPEIPGGSEAGLDAIDASYQQLVEELHPRVLSGELTRPQARTLRFRLLASSLGGRLGAGAAQRLGRGYAEAYRSARRAHPGAAALLRRLRRSLTVGVISNNLVVEQADKIRAIGLQGLIDPLVISEAVGVNKPDPRIFRWALERAACAAAESVMVGDSWTNDVEGARRSGMAAVWFRPSATGRGTRDGVPTLRALTPVSVAEDRIRSAHRHHRST